MNESNEILNYSIYQELVILDTEGNQIARITPIDVTLKDGYILKLKPKD